MRQVYHACVLPKLDYASTVWDDPLRDKGHLRVLNTVQRAALLRIIAAFKSVATQTLEVECHILPTHLRLKQRGQEVIGRLCTLPPTHPLNVIMDRTKRRIHRLGTQCRFALAETLKTINVASLNELKSIDPIPFEPWRQGSLDHVRIEQDRTQALDKVEEMREAGADIIFTDASARDSRVGAAVVTPNGPERQWSTWKVGIGPTSHWTVHTAEIIAIHKATEILKMRTVNELDIENAPSALPYWHPTKILRN